MTGDVSRTLQVAVCTSPKLDGQFDSVCGFLPAAKHFVVVGSNPINDLEYLVSRD